MLVHTLFVIIVAFVLLINIRSEKFHFKFVLDSLSVCQKSINFLFHFVHLNANCKHKCSLLVADCGPFLGYLCFLG